MEYIQSEKEKDGCVFCRALEVEDGIENLIVYRGKYTFVILNRFPYTSGHLMVVPLTHKASLEELNKATQDEMMQLANWCLHILKALYRPQGFNLGMNIGEAAGAGILEHVHMHIVPRWVGDTNFMSTLGRTRVLPESLEDTYIKIKNEWDKTVQHGQRKKPRR